MDLSQQAQAEKAKRVLARRHMRNFVPFVFPSYRIRPYNQLICDTLDLCVEGVITRLMIFMPPQYGKSELVSRKLPAFYLGRYPEKRIILASYAATLAYELSRDARNLILTDKYQQVFGSMSSSEEPIQLSEDSRSVHTWNLDGHRGGLAAAGIGGGIAGKPADFAIIDDPVKDDVEAQSATTKEQHHSWYWSALVSRLSPGAPVILTMTRWAEDDLAGKLLSSQDDVKEYWYVLRLTAVAESPTQTERWCQMNHVKPEYYLTREIVDDLCSKTR